MTLRFSFINCCVVVVILLTTVPLLYADQSGAMRPNILFAIADDWGWPHAGAYGDPVVKTPAFDRIAKESGFHSPWVPERVVFFREYASR